MTNFVLCIHVQIRFASTEKNYSHRLACILFSSKVRFMHTSTATRSHSCSEKNYAYASRTSCFLMVTAHL